MVSRKPDSQCHISTSLAARQKQQWMYCTFSIGSGEAACVLAALDKEAMR